MKDSYSVLSWARPHLKDSWKVCVLHPWMNIAKVGCRLFLTYFVRSKHARGLFALLFESSYFRFVAALAAGCKAGVGHICYRFRTCCTQKTCRCAIHSSMCSTIVQMKGVGVRGWNKPPQGAPWTTLSQVHVLCKKCARPGGGNRMRSSAGLLSYCWLESALKRVKCKILSNTYKTLFIRPTT